MDQPDRWSSMPGPGCSQALDMLREAAALAADAGVDVWQFAVELEHLCAAGVSRTDLRWLTATRRVLHGMETAGADDVRVFAYTGSLAFGPGSCFVFSGTEPHATTPTLWSLIEVKPAGMPRWDRELRELCVDGVTIKRFRVPATNQERVLAAFEEDGWPPRVDDPLPPAHGVEPKRRLRATVQSLNRSQHPSVMRFSTDGLGTGVCWNRIER